jgi:hypothetical protein
MEFIDTILEPGMEHKLEAAASIAASGADLVRFVRQKTGKLKRLLDDHLSITPAVMLRNKFLLYYFEALRGDCDDDLIDRAQKLLKVIKEMIKGGFSPLNLYETEEIIEEVRSLGGGIVVPHPELFLPILLADYDVDGYEVWNPQSHRHTDFLIDSIQRQNSQGKRRDKPLLIFMGDDCHVGDKVRRPKFLDPEKLRREVGVQPAWEDPHIRETLARIGVYKSKMISAYKERLD